MPRIKTLAGQNIRSLLDFTSPLEIKPITILLGKNSAGKSTFARLLPLLRQSSERRKKSPILWYGDYVDYGTLQETITNGKDSLQLSIEVAFDNGHLFDSNAFDARTPLFFGRSAISIKKATITITMRHWEETKENYTSSLSIKTCGTTIDLQFEPKSDNTIELKEIKIGRKALPLHDQPYAVRVSQGRILPRLTFHPRSRQIISHTAWIYGGNPWSDAILKTLRANVHAKTSEERIYEIRQQLPISDTETLTAAIKSIKGPKSWDEFAKSIKPTSPAILNMRDDLLAGNLSEIIAHIDEALSSAVDEVCYLNPVRANAERYYRRQDLAVSEIDPTGNNLPMFLDSLSPRQLSNFQAWCSHYLGFKAKTESVGAQISIHIQSNDTQFWTNIVDMGFGISQVLPIAAQIWALTDRELNNRSAPIVVIEQPELHLHPAYQAKLADLFVAATTPLPHEVPLPHLKDRLRPSFVLESHSHDLVNRLGRLVAKKKIDANKISILIFEPRDEAPNLTRIRQVHFDDKGILQNWPLGFFDPEE